MSFKKAILAAAIGVLVLVAVVIVRGTARTETETQADTRSGTGTGTGTGTEALEAAATIPNFPGPGEPWQGPGYVRGAINAPVTVIDFSDFGCPFCAKFAQTTYPALEKEFVATGKVRWIYIPFVMGMFPNGEQAALAAECAAEAGDAAFWKMHDALYESQRAWKASRDPQADFRALATQSGVAAQAFDACYAANKPAARIAAANDLSQRAGVRATPTFFVQGRIVEGALPLPTFRALLDEAVRDAGVAR